VRKAIAIIVFLSLFSQCVIQLGVLAYYNLNKDYIAKNLCVNRNKRGSKCCGKCFLTKQLNKVDDTDWGKNLPNKIEKNEPFVYVITAKFTFRNLQTASLSVKNPARQNMHGSILPHSFFHPPAFC
jgi:hypothetical protein